MSKGTGWVIIVLMVCVGLSSCSFHRMVTRRKAKSYDSNAVQHWMPSQVEGRELTYKALPQPDTDIQEQDNAAAMGKLINELTPVWEKRAVYKTFSGKARVHFDGPDDKQEFTANIRIRKDSAIWINISAFGISAARIFITPDSFFLIMQLKKEYKRLPMKDAAKVLPVFLDFAALQRLILGEPLNEGGKLTNVTSFGGTWTAEGEDKNYTERITYNKADSTIRTSQLRANNNKGLQAMSEYGSYELADGRKIAAQRVINIQNGGDNYMIDMIFLKESFDEQLEYPFSIPGSYTEAK